MTEQAKCKEKVKINKVQYEYEGQFRWVLDEKGERIRNTKEMKCCKTWFNCTGFTNTCPECENDYNWAGQLLASRSQWGEETGESLSDILSIDSTTTEDLLE